MTISTFQKPLIVKLSIGGRLDGPKPPTDAKGKEPQMIRDEMIEKIELTIASAMGMYIMPGSTINEAAAAVLDLCGPKPLIWKRNGDHWACGREGLVIRKIASRFTLTRRNAFDQTFDTIKAAKAAAHWANTRMGDV